MKVTVANPRVMVLTSPKAFDPDVVKLAAQQVGRLPARPPRRSIKKMQTNYAFNIKEMEWQDQILALPPDRDELDYALFQKDVSASWTSIFYEGIEHELMLFDVMMFGFWQLTLENTMHALLLTYLTQKFLDFVRQELGARNLAKTTLVGDRFFL